MHFFEQKTCLHLMRYLFLYDMVLDTIIMLNILSKLYHGQYTKILKGNKKLEFHSVQQYEFVSAYVITGSLLLFLFAIVLSYFYLQ